MTNNFKRFNADMFYVVPHSLFADIGTAMSVQKVIDHFKANGFDFVHQVEDDWNDDRNDARVLDCAIRFNNFVYDVALDIKLIPVLRWGYYEAASIDYIYTIDINYGVQINDADVRNNKDTIINAVHEQMDYLPPYVKKSKNLEARLVRRIFEILDDMKVMFNATANNFQNIEVYKPLSSFNNGEQALERIK